MNRVRFAAALSAIALAGCSMSFLEPDKVEYKSAGKLPPLEIPPDLTAPSTDQRYAVPDVNPSPGSATYSAYSAERSGAAARSSAASAVLPAVDKVKLERAGSERWLVVPEPPDKVWPVVKQFWQEQGFLIKTEDPATGVMETDWAENRAKIPQDPIRNLLGKVFEGAYSTAERDKFRTRLEHGKDPNTTEIYISHRGVAEVYTNANQDYTVWQPRPPDPELEAEFLRRLMVYFGVEDARARAMLASASAQPQRAKLLTAQDGSGMLELNEPFDRAWRRVGLALDRVGFTVEDRDRSKGFYYVRYIDPEKDAQEKKNNDGFLSKLLFWRSNKTQTRPEQYRVLVREQNDTSEVQVLDKNGAADRSDTARKILSLLYDQLK